MMERQLGQAVLLLNRQLKYTLEDYRVHVSKVLLISIEPFY